jgi:hypothetical protein
MIDSQGHLQTGANSPKNSTRRCQDATVTRDGSGSKVKLDIGEVIAQVQLRPHRAMLLRCVVDKVSIARFWSLSRASFHSGHNKPI